MASLKTKICFICPRAYHLFNEAYATGHGGAEVQFALLAKELARRGDYEVHFVTADFDQPDGEVLDGVIMHKTFRLTDPLPLKSFKLLGIVNRIRPAAIAQITITPFSWFLGLCAKAFGASFIYFVAHDQETDRTLPGFRKPGIGMLYDWNWKCADVVITQNNYQRDKLAERGVKSTIIKNWFLLDRADKMPGEFHLWIARSDFFKKPEELIRLAKRFPQETFCMICPQASSTPEAEYAALLEDARKTVNLTFVAEYIPFSKLKEYYARAKTFIITSTREGFATTLIQAGQHQLPIISLHVNPDNYITEWECGLFGNGDFERWAGQFGSLLRDSEESRRLGANSLRYVLETHALEKNAGRFDLVLSETLGRKRGHSLA